MATNAQTCAIGTCALGIYALSTCALGIYALSTFALCTYAFCLLASCILCLLSSAFCPPSSLLYICSDIITFVGRTLQISLFMQNKANFQKSQMNVTSIITMVYENRTLSERGKNKANTKPIKANQSQFAGCSK